MSTKHVFNESDGLVLKALKGAVWLNPGLRLHVQSKSVYAHQRSNNARVALISGGGAGHEPAHAGYTGRGMLAASVSGDIFASPSAAQVLTCIKLAVAAQDKRDVLLIVNNYTGDRLNFGLAAVRAQALGKGVRVETVVVADDVALCDRPSLVGARGLAGNIIICKLLGGAAEIGLSLDELKGLGDALTASLASIGVGLAHCHVPGRTKRGPEDTTILDGECELGLGLHNEPGVRRMGARGVKELVGTMLDQILTSEMRRARAEGDAHADERTLMILGKDSVDEVVLYVNNLGGMSVLEMSAIVDEVVQQLATTNIHPARVLSSSYMTSLNAPGFSISLLNLSSACRRLKSFTKAYSPSHLLEFLDAPTEATSWSGVTTHWPGVGSKRDILDEEEATEKLLQSSQSDVPDEDSQNTDSSVTWRSLDIRPEAVESGIRNACKAVLSIEPELTRFDTLVGDGDCGETFSSGAKAVLSALDNSSIKVNEMRPARLISMLADLLLNSMGGTSGAIFGLYFSALSNALTLHGANNATPDAHQLFCTAPLSALNALSVHTPARPGDRTLIDALAPFCEALATGKGLERAVQGARAGAEGTRGMQARLGRATYVGMGGEDDREKLPPDPGAWGVAAIVEGLVEGLRK